ncbi:MAG: BTAD domain-containing putative transcriptional regulator [Vulcanimicrobiaceae bacterium]
MVALTVVALTVSVPSVDVASGVMRPATPAASRIVLFGAPALERATGTTPLGLPPRAHALLAILVLGYERPALRASLAARLWPDVTDEEARTKLRRHLHLIDRALPGEARPLVLTRSTARWNPDGAVSCDLLDFVRAARDPQRYDAAVRLYTGELCSGIADDALEPLRRDVAASYERALRGVAANTGGDVDGTVAMLALRRLVEADPFDEAAGRTLVRARFESGDRAGAMREYHALVTRLQAELGIEPERETSDLLVRMFARAHPAATPHNLGTPSSSFVGRTTELQAVVEGLEGDRIVAIVGAPGVGKTRIALECAAVMLGRFDGGVWFVELARCESAESALERVARVLDVAPGSDPASEIASRVRHRRVLLVLDNLEQLGDDALRLVEILLARTDASLLVTSRRRTHARGERAIPVEPLDVPPLVRAARDPQRYDAAVRLFFERATKVAPGLRLTFANARSVTSIVRRLDGIPLAIELVASRANLLTLDGIAKRLDDGSGFASARRDGRHVTIEAAIAWSYELLTPLERAVFRRIAVFAESCSAESLEAICGPVAGGDAVDVLSELVESSLLQTAPSDDVRYRTFETTRAFAMERLREHGEASAVAALHAEHYTGLVEALAASFTGEGEQAAYARCDLEYGNLMLALEWSLAHEPVRAARLVAALWRHWIFRGRAHAGSSFVARLERSGVIPQLPAIAAARVLQAAGMLARETHLSEAGRYLERARAGFRSCADESGELDVLTALAAVDFTRQDYDGAEAQYRACLALQDARGDRRAASGTLANLAQIEWVRGDYDAALETLDRALAGFRETKNARGIAHAFRTRSSIFGTIGRYDEAIVLAKECVALYESLGEPARVGEALSALADQLVTAGRVGEAFETLCRSLDVLAEVGHEAFTCNALRSLHLAAAHAREYEDVVRVDTVLRALAARIGQPADNLDGSTQRDLAAARAALPARVVDATREAATLLDERSVVAIARRLAARHAAAERRSS